MSDGGGPGSSLELGLPEALSLLGSMWDVHWFVSAHKKEPLLRKAMEEEKPRSLNAGSGALFPG